MNISLLPFIHYLTVCSSTVYATNVNPCCISVFSPFIQSGGITFKGTNKIVHQNQVHAEPFLENPSF